MSLLFALKDAKRPENFPLDPKVITHSVSSLLSQWERLTTIDTDTKGKKNTSDPKEITQFYFNSKEFNIVVDDNAKSKLSDSEFISMLKTLKQDKKLVVLSTSTEKARLFSYLAVRQYPH
jgi:hypothetical protein